MEYVTDGAAVRRVQRGRIGEEPAGTVTLVPADRSTRSTRYVLDPAFSTYYVLEPEPPQSPGAEPALSRTGVFETVAGFKAETVLVSWRENVPEAPPGMEPVVAYDVELLCTSELKVPASFNDMMSPIKRVATKAFAEQYAKACPVGLKHSMRVSVFPGYVFVTTVTSVERTAVAPDLFTVPTGYRKVPSPRRSPD